MTSTIKSSMATVETLAASARLIRMGNVRVLHLNAYYGASGALTIPEEDRPSYDVIAPSVVSAVSNDIRLGVITVRTTGVVDRHYAPNYHSTTSGLASVSSTDRVRAFAVWTVD